MNEVETQKLLEKFKKLPQQMKEAIVSTDIDNAVLDIARKHSLLLPEAGQLDNEIIMVLIGEKQASDFIKNIEKEIELPKEKALAIGKEVNEMIFEKIRSQMKAATTPPKPVENSVQEPAQAKPAPQKIEVKKVPEPSIAPQPKPTVSTPQPAKEEVPEKQSLGISPTKPESVPAQTEKPFLKENVQEKPAGNIMEQKLNNPITTPAKEIQKEPEEKNKPDAGSSKIDPYREPIE